jgi:hypothetical protein
MANTYASTVLLAAREWQSETMLKKFEQRRDFSTVHKVFEDGQRYIPDLEKIKQSESQTTTTLYLKNTDITINSAKSCSPSGEVGGTGSVDLSWTIKSGAVKVNMKQHQNNELKAAQALANLLYNFESSIWQGSSGMEAAYVSYLDTNRTYVNAISTGNVSENTWSAGPLYTVDVAYADRDDFWNYALHDMELNNYTGKMWDVANTYAGSDRAFYSNQGAANSTNYEYQFNMPAQFELCKTNKIQPSGYVKDIHYIIPEGGVAALFWNNPLNRSGFKGADGKEWTIMESMLHPGIFYDVFITEACADTSDDGGQPQDLVMTYELSLNYALTKQPITTTNETPIFKYRTRSS